MSEKDILKKVIGRFLRKGGRLQGGALITDSATEPCCLHAAVRYATGWRDPHTPEQDDKVRLGRRTMRHIEKTMKKLGIKERSAIVWNDNTSDNAEVIRVLRIARDSL